MKNILIAIILFISFNAFGQSYQYVIKNGVYVKEKILSPEELELKAQGMAATIMAVGDKWEAYDQEKADFLAEGLTGPEADAYVALMDGFLTETMSKKTDMMNEVNSIVNPVSVNTDGTVCNDVNDGDRMTIWGDYTFSDGDCDSRNDTNGDYFVFRGSSTGSGTGLLNPVGVTFSSDTVTINSSGWSFDVSGGFIIDKIGGVFADFLITEK